MDASREPVPFEVYQPGVHLHGSKADLGPGTWVSPSSQPQPGAAPGRSGLGAVADPVVEPGVHWRQPPPRAGPQMDLALGMVIVLPMGVATHAILERLEHR